MYFRHAMAGIIGILFVWLFWESRPEWSPDMRLWRAFGDASFMLLFLSLVIGPLARLWKPFVAWLPWRNQTGIWFAVLALVHGYLTLDGWAQWDLNRLLGYEFIPQLGRMVRLEPGFGLSNLLGLVALFWAVVLMATSTERVMKKIGSAAWKWLHTGSYVIFYLVALHAVYFLFIHYTLSFHKAPAPPNWFQIPFLVLIFAVPALQVLAFAKTVRRRTSFQ